MIRREFLKNSACAISMTALASQFRFFGLIDAFAQKDERLNRLGNRESYKALVCVFMKGGNDGNNTLIPAHNDATISNYADYERSRGAQGLALEQRSLLEITVPRMGNLTYGLHPALGPVDRGLNNGIHELWERGTMAIAANVGCLAAPLTREQYINRTRPIPENLFSHSSQIAQTQAGRADRVTYTGWGGRAADLMTPIHNPAALIPMITSIDGVQIFASGGLTLPLTIKDAMRGLDRVLALHGFTGTTTANARLQGLHDIIGLRVDQEYLGAANQISDQAVRASEALAAYEEVTVDFPETGIGKQLKQVARLIKKRSNLGVSRQIFYCQIDGFDNHNNQLGTQASLLGDFGQAVRAFYDETVAQGVSADVTTFTMSDFGRTLQPSGTGVAVGTDHGWANHLFIIGDSVIGGDFYGLSTTNGTPYPTLLFDGPDDSDFGPNPRGRWIPTTSVEQYAATLARWYGLPEKDMTAVFPNLDAFSTSNLGFMT